MFCKCELCSFIASSTLSHTQTFENDDFFFAIFWQTPAVVKEVVVVQQLPAAISAADELRTKQTFERLLPDLPAGPANYVDWLAHVDAYIQQHHSVIINNKNSSSNSNSEPTTTTINNAAAVADTAATKASASAKIANGNSSSADDLAATTEDLILQNAKLQGTVTEYKTIVAETVRIIFFCYFNKLMIISNKKKMRTGTRS